MHATQKTEIDWVTRKIRLCSVYKTRFWNTKDTNRPKVKVWKKIRYTHSEHEVDVLAVVVSEYPSRWVLLRQGHLLIKGSVHQEDVVMRMHLPRSFQLCEVCEAGAKRRNGTATVTRGGCRRLSQHLKGQVCRSVCEDLGGLNDILDHFNMPSVKHCT